MVTSSALALDRQGLISKAGNNEPPDLLDPQWRQSGPPAQPGYQRPGRPPTPEPKRAPIGVIVTTVIVVVVLAAVGWWLTPHAAQIPTSYTTFTTPDNIFTCDAPAGWTQTLAAKYTLPGGGSDDDAGGVVFESGSAKIDVTIDSVVKLKANELLNSSTAVPGSLGEAPVVTLHKRTIISNLRGYSEQGATSYESQMGPAMSSEWTASGPLFGIPTKLHGYRVSMVADQYTIVVVCEGLDSQWAQLQPVFTHVIDSIAPGSKLMPASNTPAQ